MFNIDGLQALLSIYYLIDVYSILSLDLPLRQPYNFLFVFLTPPVLPGVPEVWFHVRRTYVSYGLSMLGIKT